MNDTSSGLLETARMFMEIGRYLQAAALTRKALCLQPNDPDALSLLGILEQSLGNSDGARLIFQQLLELAPDNHLIWSNHGVVCLSLGDREAALNSFETALRLCPDYADAWNNLGAVHEKYDIVKAQACFERALEIKPDYVEACNNLALCYKKQQFFSKAITWYQKSLEFAPKQPDTLYRLAELLEQTSEVDGARKAYRKSLDFSPDDCIRLKMETILPVILPSADAIDALRDTLRSRLLKFLETEVRIDKPWEKGRVFFYLAYHGRDDREFHELLAKIYRAACPDLTWQASHVDGARVAGKRIRVGFFSRFFYNHTIAKLTIGFIESLDRSRFQVTVLAADTGKNDQMLQRFVAAADNFIVMTGDFLAMREQIAAQQLDVLVYTDIGMEPFSYFMAFSRLAPIQCVTWGHPATSGIDTIDYFISHAECETVQGRQSYSEKLFCLSSAAACTCYARPLFPGTAKTRQEFGIAPELTIYYCPQPPFKMHPDFDCIIKGILERDPNGVVILLRGVVSETETLLKNRLARLMPTCLGRVIFMDPLSFGDYMAMLKLADVVLDTPHFSGGNSSLEALAAGAVVVTLPSEFLKGRLTYAWYRRLGIKDCIAGTPEEYVDIAVRLGTDQTMRAGIRSRIKSASHLLFDDQQAVRELETFFEEAVHHE